MELRFFDVLIYPPAINILLLIAALLLWKKRKTSLALISISLTTLIIFSTPVISSALIKSLEKHPPIPPTALTKYNAGAIVVLGGGSHPYAAEYDDASLTYSVVERIRYAAFIYRHTGLPILVTEGKFPHDKKTGASIMRKTLSDDYGIQNIILEEQAMSSKQNAIYSVALLKKLNIKKVFLVTNSWHMQRSVYIFKQQDIEVIPAPTLAQPDKRFNLRELTPDASALNLSRRALHEYLGLLWYMLQDSLLD